MGPSQTYKPFQVKINHKKNKRQQIELEKLFTNDVTDKGLTSKICERSYNNNKRQTTQRQSELNTLIDISPKKTYRWLVGT